MKVQGEIEGLINKCNLSDPAAETLEEAMSRYNVGDTVQATVVEVNPGKQKLGLSLRDYQPQGAAGNHGEVHPRRVQRGERHFRRAHEG